MSSLEDVMRALRTYVDVAEDEAAFVHAALAVGARGGSGIGEALLRRTRTSREEVSRLAASWFC